MGFDGSIEKNACLWGEFLIPHPQDIDDGNPGKDVQGDGFVAETNWGSTQGLSGLDKALWIVAVFLFDEIDTEGMGTSEKGFPTG